MIGLFTAVAARSAGIVAVLLLAGVAVFLSWSDRTAAQRERDQQLALVGAVLAVTDDADELRTTLARSSPSGDLAVHLADGTRVGPSRASADQVRAAARDRSARAVDAGEDRSYLQPVTQAGGGTAVIEARLSGSRIGGPTLGGLGGLAVLALTGTALAVYAARRMSAPVVRRLRELGNAAMTPDPAGLARSPSPAMPELAAIAAMIDRVHELTRQLVEREHKMIGDVSHRLRTPLTALRLDVETIAPGPVTDRIRSAVVAMEHDVGEIIRTAGQPPEPVEPATSATAVTDLADVVRRRMEFWQILAVNQNRRCEHDDVDALGRSASVPLAEDDVADIVNNLVGNVFRHTEPGVPLAVTVGRHAGWVSLVVDDGGTGIADPEAALQRGVSGHDSTGLGLDIVRRLVEASGGAIHIERGRLGGARVRLRFPEVG